MRFATARVIVVIAVLAAVGCRPEVQTPPPLALQAPQLERIGNARLQITTSEPRAQQFFDQGLRLAYAFDHAEALRAFAEASRLDPDCAMCAWGMAYAVGPNINAPLRPADPRAAKFARRAVALADKGTAKERALIEAMAARLDLSALPPGEVTADRDAASGCVAPPPPKDADPLDLAYVQAMVRVARAFADDDEVAVLYAEALMMLSPWEWWNRDGTPREGTLAAIDTLERVLARSPAHAGANHFLIHALEGSPKPQRALASAERLGALAPDAGHMVHMPSHIFMRVGRYADAIRVNREAIEADHRLAAQLRAQSFASLGHVSHHHHFLWAAAALKGDAATALQAAQWLAIEAARAEQPFGAGGSNDYFLGLPWLAQVRFARWDDILAARAPEWPAHASGYAAAIWHYARGIALARSGKPEAAAKELEQLQAAGADPRLEGLTLKGIDDLSALLALAEASLRGEIALAQRQYRRAVADLRRAVELEDALESEEPPPWPVPTRQALGAALLLAGDAAGAEANFRADLDRFPDNGWALHGLAESLRRQKRLAEATLVEMRFRTAWIGTDPRSPDARY